MASNKRSKNYRKQKKKKISTKPPIRTLKRSTRKQLSLARAPNLWILPRIRDDGVAFPAHAYPRASFMGLPAELRQQILYETCNVKTLAGPEAELITDTTTPSRDEKNLVGVFKGVRGKELRAPHLGARGRALLSLLGRKIGVLCAVCPVLREDMKFVGKMWYQELEVLLHGSKGVGLSRVPSSARLGLLVERTKWLQSNKLGVRMPGEKKTKKKGTMEGRVQKVKGKKARARKCWNCTERHKDGDPVCPAARKDPAKWMQLTKKVRGKKEHVGASSVFRGKKIVFSE